jgi:hypothetical protein
LPVLDDGLVRYWPLGHFQLDDSTGAGRVGSKKKITVEKTYTIINRLKL